MNILTAHEGTMPSTDTSPSKSHLTEKSEQILTPLDMSFSETFSGHPHGDTPKVSISDGQDSQASEGLNNKVSARTLNTTFADDILNDQDMTENEVSMAGVMNIDAITHPHALPAKHPITQVEALSSQNPLLPPKQQAVAALELASQTQPTSNPDLQYSQDEASLDTLTKYLKMQDQKALIGQNDTTSFQSLLPVAEELSLSDIKSSVALNPIIQAPSTQLQPLTTVTMQASPQILQVPVRDIAQNIVRATLKQERSLIRIDPPELGRIQLDFDHSSSGKTIVTLSAEIDSVKMMLIERRALMIGIFEGFGLEDVEIQIDNQFDPDNESSSSQLFSNRDDQTQLHNKSESLTNISAPEDIQINTEGKTSISNSQHKIHRLHIRV